MAQLKNELGGRCAQIRHEIDRTRLGIDRKLDALEARLTPREMAFDAWTVLRDGSVAGASKVWRAAQEHPLPATMIAAGIGWLIAESQSGGSRGRAVSEAASGASRVAGRIQDRVAGTAERFGEAASATAAQVGEKFSDTAASVRDQASHLREQAAQIADSARERAAHLAEQTRERGRQASDSFWRFVDDQPLAVGLAVLAAGVAAGLAIPATRREDELMGDTRDQLLDQAQQAGREALEKGKRVAEKAVDAAKTAAERAELDPAHLADKVREVGQEAKQAASEEASHTVR
jgi:ElaB/YqjD/DUF883 family membrane-anchored ribosome-binding protein